MSRRIYFFAVVFLMIATVVPDALGCPVCFGDSDEQILKGVEMSVLFMIGLTYLLLGGSAALIFFVYRRHLRRRSAEQGETPLGPVAQDHEPALEGA